MSAEDDEPTLPAGVGRHRAIRRFVRGAVRLPLRLAKLCWAYRIPALAVLTWACVFAVLVWVGLLVRKTISLAPVVDSAAKGCVTICCEPDKECTVRPHMKAYEPPKK